MANLVDLYLVYRILRRLTQPFTDWEAYKQGVIDDEGNILKKSDDRNTQDEKDSLTKFDLLILKLKKLLGTIPFGKTKLASYVAALWFLKEEKRLTEDNLQEEFEKFCIKEKMLTEGFINEQRVDKHELSGYVVIDGYVFTDAGKSGRSTYGRYATKDPNYVKDPKETGMHRNYRRPSTINFDTLAKAKAWVKTQPKKSASEIEDTHKKYAEREQMYHEEAPANVASSGAVAGLTGDPPVGKKAQKKYTSRFANNDVFVVDSKTYNNARLGKQKYHRYERYVGNDEIGVAIREYGKKNPKKPIILQDGENGPMIFLRRGRNTFKEHFELNEEISAAELKGIEMYADKLFKAVGIDVEFTRHFLDRVNDARNVKDITPTELALLFRKTYAVHGQKIPKLGPDAEAVIADMASNINLPFVLKWDRNTQEFDLVAKTVMRKKNFMTSNPKLKV
jgi:hypothetical protein